MLRNHIKKLMLLQTSVSRDFDIYSCCRAMQLTMDLLWGHKVLSTENFVKFSQFMQ